MARKIKATTKDELRAYIKFLERSLRERAEKIFELQCENKRIMDQLIKSKV